MDRRAKKESRGATTRKPSASKKAGASKKAAPRRPAPQRNASAVVRHLLERISGRLDAHPEGIDRVPASEEHVHTLEDALGRKLPEELLAVLRFESPLRVLEYARILPDHWETHLSRAAASAGGEASFAARRWLPLFEDGGGNLWLVDLSGEQPVMRQWALAGRVASSRGTSLQAFFARLTLVLESGKLRYDPESGTYDGPFFDLSQPPPITDDMVIVFRTAELAATDLGVDAADHLPPGAGPHDCLFFISVEASSQRLFEAVEEEDVDHADEGMELADAVASALDQRCDLSAFGEDASVGFHASRAEATERWLRSQEDLFVAPLATLLVALEPGLVGEGPGGERPEPADTPTANGRDANEVYERYEEVCRALVAETQRRRGYVSDARAERAGLDPALREAAIQAGLIVRVAPGVLNLDRLEGNDSIADRAIRAWLATGERAVVSHESALMLLSRLDTSAGEHATLHLTLPEQPTRGLEGLGSVRVHLGSVPEVDRSWSGLAPVPFTSAARTLLDCAEAGVDESLLARARRELLRLGLLVEPGVNVGPSVADPALRLALLSDLLPHSEIAERVDRIPRAELAAWAAAVPTPAPTKIDTTLKWSADDPLFRALPAGHDGDVRELAGLDGHSGLTILDLRRSRIDDLEPLVGLPQLVAVHVGVTAKTSLVPLLRCPNLRRVRLDGYVERVHGATRAELEARGVVVDLVRGEAPLSAPPFRDPNLKLAVLDTLAEAGELELPALVPIDADELDREHLAKLLAIPLTAAQLASIERLVWEPGGMAIEHLVWPQFDGESDAFVLCSLDGIDALPNLRELHLAGAALAPTSPEVVALRARGVEVHLA